MNIREKAMKDLIEEAKKHQNILPADILERSLMYLSDLNLLALYVEVFGHPVNATSNNTTEVL